MLILSIGEELHPHAARNEERTKHWPICQCLSSSFKSGLDASSWGACELMVGAANCKGGIREHVLDDQDNGALRRGWDSKAIDSACLHCCWLDCHPFSSF